MLWSVLFAVLALAECPETPVTAVRDGVSVMEVSFVDLEEATFAEARARVDDALPCVTYPLDLRDILALHRAMALAAFMEGDMSASRKSWGAVKALRPGWEPSVDVAPPGHLLRGLFDDAEGAGALVELELAPSGGWIVDGRQASAVPSERAFLLQAVGDEGIFYTGYQLSVAEIPITELAQPLPRLSERTRRTRKTGALVAGGLAAASLGALAVHLEARSALGKVDYDKIQATQTRANVAGVSAIVLGAGAAGVFAVTWGKKW